MKKTLSAFNLIFKIDLKSQSEIKKNIEEREERISTQFGL